MTERQIERIQMELNASLRSYQRLRKVSEQYNGLYAETVAVRNERINAQLDLIHMAGLRAKYDAEANEYIIKRAKLDYVVCTDKDGNIHKLLGPYDNGARAFKECEEWGWKYTDENGKTFYMSTVELD